MDKKQKILESRERLDKTLAMPDLVNDESIKSLVKDQLLRSSFHGNEGNMGKVVEKRAMEVSNFLEMLRSASVKDPKAVKNTMYNEWKVKQDTDQLRVMYREGPHGTPFHTLLCEGFADGPPDVCLCVSWETTLYKKWWPQYNIPTFKITMSSGLQKVCIGEEISLMRVKVAWPVSDREAILHYFEIEYFKEDLVIVLMNTISDSEQIDVNTHGFSSKGIPAAKDTVRIDLVGGFVLQKVDSNRCYFRVIANMDIKLDFVPPTLINFVARQLIGNGHKLYQKAVGSVATSDEDYRQALEGSLYARIREGLDPINKTNMTLVDLKEEKHGVPSPKEHADSVVEIKPVTEIVEEEMEQTSVDTSISQSQPTDEHMSMETLSICPEQSPSSSSANVMHPTTDHARKVYTSISPEVEQALRMLDQAIAVVRGRVFSESNQSESRTSESVLNSCSVCDGAAPKNVAQDVSNDEDFRNTRMASAPKGGNGDQRELTLPNDMNLDSYETLTAESTVAMTRPPISESMRKVCDEESLRLHGYHGFGGHQGKESMPGSKQGKKKKQGFPCCINLSLFRG